MIKMQIYPQMLQTIQMMALIKIVMEAMQPMVVAEIMEEEVQPVFVTIHADMQTIMYATMEERGPHLMIVLLEQIVLIVAREIPAKNHVHHGTRQHIPIMGFARMAAQIAATVPVIEGQTV